MFYICVLLVDKAKLTASSLTSFPPHMVSHVKNHATIIADCNECLYVGVCERCQLATCDTVLWTLNATTGHYDGQVRYCSRCANHINLSHQQCWTIIRAGGQFH